jgi:hypothetical protein
MTDTRQLVRDAGPESHRKPPTKTNVWEQRARIARDRQARKNQRKLKEELGE